MATENTNPETPGQEAPNGEQQLSEETRRLAELGRSGDTAPPEFRPQDQGKPQRPADVPEKFWDSEKGVVNQDALLKSYLELEKNRGQKPPVEGEPKPEEKAPEGEKTPDAPEDKGEEPDPNAAPSALSSAIEAAQADYATNKGELSAEARKGLIDAGIPEAALDQYIQGVKATEAAMIATAQEAAGDVDVNELLTWAAQNLEEAQITHLNAGLANPKTLADTVADLASRYARSNPGEGRLQNLSSGTNYGEVYDNKDQFLADLAKADASGDKVARQNAVQKLARSKKAGTLKEVTPRSGPFRR